MKLVISMLAILLAVVLAVSVANIFSEMFSAYLTGLLGLQHHQLSTPKSQRSGAGISFSLRKILKNLHISRISRIIF